jgi:hypothetical protein
VHGWRGSEENDFITFNIIAYIPFKDNAIQCLKMNNKKRTTENRCERRVWFQGRQADKINLKSSSFNIETTKEREILGKSYVAYFPSRDSDYMVMDLGTTVCKKYITILRFISVHNIHLFPHIGPNTKLPATAMFLTADM